MDRSFLVRLVFGQHSVQIPVDILRQCSAYFEGWFRFGSTNGSSVASSPLNRNVLQIDEPLGEQTFLFVLIGDVFRRTIGPFGGIKHHSLDFLFDCTLLSSKYLLTDSERHFSWEFVCKLRESVTTTTEESFRFESLLQIRRLAHAYNLHFLQANLSALIREQRAIANQRLRMIFFPY